MYKDPESDEIKEFNKLVKNIRTENVPALHQQLTKSFHGMMKAGFQKTTDIMIPNAQKFRRLKNFMKIQAIDPQQARDNLNYNMAMFTKEQDFLRYLRMSLRSDFWKSVYGELIENIETDQIIFIPMIDGIALASKQVLKYEKPDYEIPKKD